jgi:uncharacterized protein (TIGR02270 family)
MPRAQSSTSAPVAKTRRPPILWDVVAEHLDEAGWLWEQRAESLLALDQTLVDLETGDEGRMLAHLDGLVVGGAEVARGVLLPALQGDEPRAAAGAAWALLAAEGGDWLPQVLDAFIDGKEDLRPAIRTALELSPRADLDAKLLERLPAAPLEAKRELVEALAARGANAGAALLSVPYRDDAPLHVAVVRAARTDAAVARVLLPVALNESAPSVREAALEIGMALGLRSALDVARKALERGEVSRAALLAAAVGGEASDLQLLTACVGKLATREEALWALGFSGRRAAAEAAVDAARAGAGRIAAEAFAMVTGCKLGLEAPVEPGASSEGTLRSSSRLPGPVWPEEELDADLLEFWWARDGAAIPAGGRFWFGERMATSADLLHLLERAPMRYRPAFALELSARTRGQCRVDVGALAARQRSQVSAARSLAPVGLDRPFSALFGV